jgi:predicted helicase
MLLPELSREARRQFRLCSQSQWDYARAKQELPTIDLRGSTVEVTYRPFDNRWTVWDRNVAVHRRERVTKHMLNSENIALISHRLTKDDPSVFVSDHPPAHKSGTRYDISYVFPLYADGESLVAGRFRDLLDAQYGSHFSTEEIAGYIYAILHAPTYRARYADFLRIDFPRIPFPERAEDFEALSRLGWALVEAHLLRPSLPRAGMAGYVGKGDDRVEAVRYDPSDGTVWINKTRGFRPVPKQVWEFHIGGYQVLDKYLKSRKDRVLTLDEIRHVARLRCTRLHHRAGGADRRGLSGGVPRGVVAPIA